MPAWKAHVAAGSVSAATKWTEQASEASVDVTPQKQKRTENPLQSGIDKKIK